MNFMRGNVRILLVVIPLLFFLNGCITPSVKGNVPELEARVGNFKKIVLLPPEVNIYELTSGEQREKRDKWSEAGGQNVEKAIHEVLKEKGIKVYDLRRTKANDEQIEDILQLYRAVAACIYRHTYPGSMNLFPDRVENFDYTIGSVENYLRNHRADGMLIVYGADEISTSGRKVLELVRAINPFDYRRGAGETAVEVGIVDKTGAVLWLRYRENAGGYDLRDSASALAFVKEVFKEYPGGEK